MHPTFFNHNIYITYRKVASSIPVYYSILDNFWGAANWDVLLTETCYYSIVFFLDKGLLRRYIRRVRKEPFLCLNYASINYLDGVKCIFINKDWEKSDQNSWRSYILVLFLPECRIFKSSDQIFLNDFGIWFDLLASIRYMLLLTKMCYYLNLWPFLGCY